MSITEFLTARYDEDEANVRTYLDVFPDGDMAPLFRRVVADTAAKRAILADLVREEAANFGDQFLDGLCSGLEQAVRHLAQPYAEHPDFDPAWRV